MGRRDPKSISKHKLLTQPECHQTGAIMHQIVLSSVLQPPVLSQAQFLKACRFQLPLGRRRHMKGRCSLIRQLQQFLRVFRYSFVFILLFAPGGTYTRSFLQYTMN